MVTSVPSGSTLLIMDTEQYTGAFDAALCAYTTGRVASDGRGEDYAALYTRETMQDPIAEIGNVSDDDNILTPFSIWPTPGWFNNGAGGNYIVGQEHEAIAHFRKFRLQELSNLIFQKELILRDLDQGKPVGRWTRHEVRCEIEKHRRKITNTRESHRIHTYPAYLSLAIFFDSPPSDLTLDFIKLRAFQFVEAFKDLDPNKRTINIRNFRSLRVMAQKRIPQCVAC